MCRKLLPVFVFLCFAHLPSFAKQWIVFYSSAGFETHAFVEFTAQETQLGMPVRESYYGFHPVAGKGVWTDFMNMVNGEGHLEDERLETPGNSFTVEVSNDEYQLCHDVIQTWNHSTYSLYDRNCVDFLRDLLVRVLETKIPETGYIVPQLFISRLKSLNSVLEARSLQSLYDAKDAAANLLMLTDIREADMVRGLVADRSLITYPTDKAFTWYDWDAAPPVVKEAARFIYPRKDGTEVQEIENLIKNGCSVQVALTDLDNNGILGLAVYAEGSYCCGTMDCSVDIYENAGTGEGFVQAALAEEASPAEALASLSVNRRFIGNREKSLALFTYDKAKVGHGTPILVRQAKIDYRPFTVDKNWITHGTDIGFKWFVWGHAPGEVNKAVMDIFVKEGDVTMTLAQELSNKVNERLWVVQVGLTDLDNNGVCGVAVRLDGSARGSSMKPMLIYENGGLLTYVLNRPAADGEPYPKDVAGKMVVNGGFVGDRVKAMGIFRYGR